MAQEARKEKQYNASVAAMVQAAKVSGVYLERTESVELQFSAKLEKLGEGRLDELSDQEIEQFLNMFQRMAGWSQARIEAERRKQGIIEATAMPIEPHAESS